MKLFKFMRKGIRFVNIKVFAFVYIFFIFACRETVENEESRLVRDYTQEVIWEWNELFMIIEKDAKYYRPGPAPRAISLLAYSAYEVCLPGMPNYRTLKYEFKENAPAEKIPNLKSGKGIHYPLAINASYALLMNKLFEGVSYESGQTPGNVKKLIFDLESKLDSKFKLEIDQNIELNFNNSKAWGQEVALAIWQWSLEDKLASDAYKSYEHARPHANGPIGEGFWQTYNLGVPAAFPYWGDVYAYGVYSFEKIQPLLFKINYQDTSNRLFHEMNEVVQMANAARANFNGEESYIARFWSDDRVGLTFSPPTRFVAIANQVFKNKNTNLEKTVVTMAKLGLAIHDAGVCAWKTKFYYNIERPISMIQRFKDPSWNLPWLPETPAFPAYPSGHSTFGWAATEILTHEFGEYAMTDNCHADKINLVGPPRSYNSFYQMAQENAMSRIPLGVHFRMDAEGGEILGKRVANNILKLRWEK